MKFIVDAQLPRRLARQLRQTGHDAIHCLDLSLGNRTPDDEIIAVATKDSRVLITKDSDFVVSFWLRGTPPQLLLVSTGNIPNDELADLFAANLKALETAFGQHRFVELTRTTLTVHV